MDQYLTAKQVAERLQCSVSLVRRPDMLHKLGAIRVGKRGIRFPPEAIDRYQERHQIQDTGHASSQFTTKRKRRRLQSKHGLW